jgi:IS605 OrfB family transposase
MKSSHTSKQKKQKNTPELIQRAYKYPLDLKTNQVEFLLRCTGTSRYWYNQGLGLLKQRLVEKANGEDVRVPWSYQDYCAEFKGDEIKDKICPWRKEVVIGSYQAGLMNLSAALNQYSKGRNTGRSTGFPKFKVKGKNKETVIFQRAHPIDKKHLHLSKRLGPVRVKGKMTRLLRKLESDDKARIIKATITMEGSEWFISFLVSEERIRRTPAYPNQIIGCDLGITHLLTLSNGQYLKNPRPLIKYEEMIKRLQRKLDRQRRMNNPSNYEENGVVIKGSKNWVRSNRMLRTEELIRKYHKRVRNLRRENAHYLSSMITRKYGYISTEDLSINNMLKNHKLAKHIQDASWREITRQLEYKSEWYGNKYSKVGKYYASSKTCSTCNQVKPKLGLSVREYECEHCGLVIDRDLNAALNMAQHYLIGNSKSNNESKENKKLMLAPINGSSLIARGGAHLSKLSTSTHTAPLKRAGKTNPLPNLANQAPALLTV